MAGTNAVAHVSALQGAGFSKVCVVNKSYQVVGASSQDAVPSAWNDESGTLVNENQELANDWSKAGKFCFFKIKFMAAQKSANHWVGSQGNNVIVAKQYDDAWIICKGEKRGMLDKGKGAAKFSGAADAYNKACKACFDELDEDAD